MLLRPIPIASLVVLVVNDQWLKPSLSGVVTGKLSDVAGTILAAYVAVAIVELWAAAFLRRNASTATIAAAAAVPAIGLVVVKLSPSVAHGYGELLAILRHPFSSDHLRVRVTHDIGDAIAAIGVPIAWLDIRRATKRDESRLPPCR